MARNKIIGLLIGRENTFPGPFIDTVNQKGAKDGITAELAVLGGTSEVAEPYHAVLVDRISHEVPYYRAHLKSAVLMGTVVINDPFSSDARTSCRSATTRRRLSKSAMSSRSRSRGGCAIRRSRTHAPSVRRSGTTWTPSSSRSVTTSCTRSTS